MPEVVLFNPSMRSVYGGLKGIAFPPLGLVLLATVLRDAGIPVRVLDEDRTDLDETALAARLDGAKLAGISITTPTMKAGLLLGERIRRVRPDLPIVYGGVHATLMPRDPFQSPAADYAVEGEGEKVLLALARDLLAGRTPGPIPGLWRRGPGGEPVEGPRPEPGLELDALPTPDFGLLEDPSYGYPDSLESPVLPVITSRGCPGRCVFCNALALWGRKLRFQSAARLTEDLRRLVERHGVREIHVWDDNFISSRERVRECARLFREAGLRVRLSFVSGVRVDFVDDEIIGLLKEMGAYSFALGIESGCQRILDEMKKNVTLAEIERAVAVLKRHGMETWGFFLFGMPGENAASIRETIDFALRVDPDVAKFHILKPYPGSEVARMLDEQDLILNRHYEDYGLHVAPVHRTRELSPDQLLAWQRTAYRRFYLRPGKMLREGLRMARSWHRLRHNLPVALRLVAAKILGRE